MSDNNRYDQATSGQPADDSGEPKDGKQVIDRLLPVIAENADMELADGCGKAMHTQPDSNGKTNDKSFDDCFQEANGWGKAKAQLLEGAAWHGRLARFIHDEILKDSGDKISVEAFTAAGAAVRRLCKANCGKGQWCTWP